MSTGVSTKEVQETSSASRFIADLEDIQPLKSLNNFFHSCCPKIVAEVQTETPIKMIDEESPGYECSKVQVFPKRYAKEIEDNIPPSNMSSNEMMLVVERGIPTDEFNVHNILCQFSFNPSVNSSIVFVHGTATNHCVWDPGISFNSMDPTVWDPGQQSSAKWAVADEMVMMESEVHNTYSKVELVKCASIVDAYVVHKSMLVESKNTSILVSCGKFKTITRLMCYFAHFGAHKRVEELTVAQQFHLANLGKASGAAMRTPLLARSRAFLVIILEQNHQCFSLLSETPMEVNKKCRLRDPKSSSYLKQSYCYEIAGITNAHDYANIRKVMTTKLGYILPFGTENQDIFAKDDRPPPVFISLACSNCNPKESRKIGSKQHIYAIRISNCFLSE
ncbi:hypothetical protein H5410_011979 [Solanum commersonii]|uniref:Uncharacterized protein n=1 Tax=Solanum commersonii TaxID=4109 RepID=A0A9J6AR32_SOLCO|nr:hypothetical protein H5410_011979 [Solanum commersonii]